MRALAKFVTGILRVESPPISRVEVIRSSEERSATLRVRVRFAFDTSRVTSNGGRTVRLELKRSGNPQIAPAARNSSPGFESIAEIEAQHVRNVENITIKVFNFDIARSIPDDAISQLKSGAPIEYQYLLAVPATTEPAASSIPQISDRDYLLRKLEAGIDPATLKESFPVRDPSKKSVAAVSLIDSYYTRPVSTTSSYQKMKLYSTLQIFEQDIEISTQDFLAASVYEFSYIDYTGTPIEFVEVRVQGSNIYEDLKKLQYSSVEGLVSENNFESSNPQVLEYVRDIVSNSSLVSTEFRSNVQTGESRKPQILRTHYQLPGSERQSIKFDSRVIGLPSRRSRVASNPNSTKSTVIPFYVDNTRDPLRIVIKRLPPQALRVAVHIRNVTKGDDAFTELTSQRVVSEILNSLQINLPEPDCTYEIKISSTDRKFRTVYGVNSVVYSNTTPYKNAFIRVSSPSLIGDQSVKFNISANFTDAGRQDLTELIDIINSSGVSTTTLSVDGYVSDPDLYSEVFSCRIERINLETGEQTYTKEIPLSPGGIDFVDRVDSSAGAAYVFSLGMRSPASLFPQQAYYKFGTFGGKYLSSLPSDASVAFDARSGAPFEKVDSGIKRVVEIPKTTLRGSVSSITLSKTMRETALLEWSYVGDLTEVDHFQVFGAADGVECLLGCSFRETAYEDSVLHDRVGVVTYRVRPVYISLEPGESLSVTTYRRATIPTILLPNFNNGQQWMQPITAVNSSITVDTAESYSQEYVDYFSTEIVKRERRSTSTQSAGDLRRFQTSSGLASISMNNRSPPRNTFNPAPIPESQQIVSPINSFSLAAIVEQQISPTTAGQLRSSSRSDSITTEASLRPSGNDESRSQSVAYRRNLR